MMQTAVSHEAGIPIAAVAARASGEYLTFTLGNEEYGIEILKVQEIRGYEAVTRIANTPAFIKGVVNLRGTIVPIFDLRARFGDGQTNATKNHVVVVMSVGEKWVGILVDAVSDILTVGKEEIHSVPEGNALDTDLLSGIVTHESRMVGLIDLNAIVADARIED